MDLYNAIRNGASREELVDKFLHELDQAEEQVIKEKQLREHQETVASAREEFIYALVDYIAALSNDTIPNEQLDTLDELLNDYFRDVEDSIMNPHDASVDSKELDKTLDKIVKQIMK